MDMNNRRKIAIVLLFLILISLVLLLIDKSIYKEYSKNYFYMDTYINVKVNKEKPLQLSYHFASSSKFTLAFKTGISISNPTS